MSIFSTRGLPGNIGPTGPSGPSISNSPTGPTGPIGPSSGGEIDSGKVALSYVGADSINETVPFNLTFASPPNVTLAFEGSIQDLEKVNYFIGTITNTNFTIIGSVSESVSFSINWMATP